jgi:hypothetical protein
MGSRRRLCRARHERQVNGQNDKDAVNVSGSSNNSKLKYIYM